MSKLKDLTGKVIGMWKVIERAQNDSKGRARWKCGCIFCGSERIAAGYTLKNRKHQKCQNCSVKTHGQSRKGKYHRIYIAWNSMKSRVKSNNKKTRKYYKDKGITICKEWEENFVKFLEWALENGYEDHLTLDRIDGNKGYYPENCRWITRVAQSGNFTRKSKCGYIGVFKNERCKSRPYFPRIDSSDENIILSPCATAGEAAIKRDIYLLNNDLLDYHNGNFVEMKKLKYKNL